MNVCDLIFTRLIRDYFSSYVPQIGLIRDWFDLTRTTSFADIVEAEFEGYQRYDLTGWTDPVISADRASMSANLVTWMNTGATIGENHGWFIADGADSTRMLFCTRYVDFEIVPGQKFNVLPQYTMRDDYWFFA